MCSFCPTEILYPLKTVHSPLPQPLASTIALSIELFQVFHIRGITQFLSFCDWLILRSMMSSGFLYVVIYMAGFPFILRLNDVHYVFRIFFFSHSSFDGQLGCFPTFYYVNIVARSIYERNKTLSCMDDKKKSRHLPNTYNNPLMPPQSLPQGPFSQKSWNSCPLQLHEYLFHMVPQHLFLSLEHCYILCLPIYHSRKRFRVGSEGYILASVDWTFASAAPVRVQVSDFAGAFPGSSFKEKPSLSCSLWVWEGNFKSLNILFAVTFQKEFNHHWLKYFLYKNMTNLITLNHVLF